MVWRRSSAMAGFLQQLTQVFRELPPELFVATAEARPTRTRRGRTTQRSGAP
jgi:LysR family hydrogen peroxide-inducible transcriptional activator